VQLVELGGHLVEELLVDRGAFAAYLLRVDA